MLAFVQTIARTVRELGFAASLCYGCDRLLTVLGIGRVVRYALVAQPVSQESLLPPRRGRSVEVIRVSPQDPRLNRLGELTPAALAHRERQDAKCFAAVHDDTIVGCLWVCCGPYDEDEVRCRFTLRPQGRTAWDFGVYVSPAHRGGVVFAKLWDAANAHLREHGVDWSISRISAFNISSLKAHGRLGAVRLGNATFVRIGGWQLTIALLPQVFHLSRGPSQIPRIVVAAPAAAPSNNGLSDREAGLAAEGPCRHYNGKQHF